MPRSSRGRLEPSTSSVPAATGASFTDLQRPKELPRLVMSEAERTRHKGDLVYPNLMLSASADHVAAFVLLPVAVDHAKYLGDETDALAGQLAPDLASKYDPAKQRYSVAKELARILQRREPEPEEKREAVRPGTLEHKPTSYIEGRFRH